MSTEYKINSIKSLLKFNRAVYFFMILFAFLSRVSGLTQNSTLMKYYMTVPVIILLLDRLFFFRWIKKLDPKKDFPCLLIRIRTCIYLFLFSAGGVIDIIPASLIVCIYLCMIYIFVQEFLFCDKYDTFSSSIFIVISITISGFFLFFIQYKGLVTGVWIYGFIFPIVIFVVVCIAVRQIYYRMINSLIKSYNEAYRHYMEVSAENDELKEIKEKVEKVNSEINLQKIQLARANEDLAESNHESRTLINVMKFFSSSFDIEKNADVMLENIMKVKDARAVGMYISEDVYMNENAFLEVKAADKSMDKRLRNEIKDIYQMIVELGDFEPVVICKNHEFKYPYLVSGSLCNAVAFPAYENDQIYGVMVVASSKYDFFISGFAFYETSVMDFTSALISDRLYLKTEEMAKKDGLTKIYNRVYFNQFYNDLKKEVLDSGDILTVAMMDIDHFKSVNDTYGHLAGDEVIKMVASVDNKYAERYKGTAVRFGGEEFLLVLRGIDIDEAYEILKEMHDEIISNVVEFEGLQIQVNTSMGVASFNSTCDNIESLVDMADKAMYYSKTHGRGMIVIDGQYDEVE